MSEHAERRCEEQSRCGRREECPLLADGAMEDLAEKAADRAIAKLTATVYQEVGRSVVNKMFYITGALALAAYLWAQSRGFVK